MPVQESAKKTGAETTFQNWKESSIKMNTPAILFLTLSLPLT
jgi:hypothetical protein